MIVKCKTSLFLKNDPQPDAKFPKIVKIEKSHVVAMHFEAFIMRTDTYVDIFLSIYVFVCVYMCPDFGPRNHLLFL